MRQGGRGCGHPGDALADRSGNRRPRLHSDAERIAARLTAGSHRRRRVCRREPIIPAMAREGSWAMRRVMATKAVAVLAARCAGCASLKGEDVKVYEPTQLSEKQYDAVARLWVETWRARTWVPTYASREDAVAALQDKAAALGANGLINLGCYADPGLFSIGDPAYLCYGNAIKVG